MLRLGAQAGFCALILAVVLTGCGQTARTPASAPDETQQYVVMVSLDGFRHDYAERYQAHNVLAIARNGVAAKAMTPSFPSRTFPSHYSIVTGLHPARHGLVANEFYDSRRDERYSLKDRAAVGDGSWYGGTPLWVLAERHGIRTASYYWVGSEAAIQGVRPSYYFEFDKSVSYAERVAELGRWLRLPEDDRPRLVLMYFSLVDSAGHFYGPETAELAEAVATVDRTVGRLRRELAATGLPVNLILVSDHGMVPVNNDRPIWPADHADLSAFEIADDGPLQMYYSDDDALVRRTYAALADKANGYRVWLREEVPDYLRFRDNPRIGDIVVLAEAPNILAFDRAKRINPATHGFDPYTTPQMGGIFYASGPAFQSGTVIDTFESVHVYPLVARILGLEHDAVDGRLEVLQPTLR